ncbi:MAG: hypothetical protein KDC83_14025 [Flavobacteriales bacterium]|nr:hypothetical protein [Flavobacteriales bacterium]
MDSPTYGKWSDKPGARQAVEKAKQTLELVFHSPVPIQIEVRLFSFKKWKKGKDFSSVLAYTINDGNRKWGNVINNTTTSFMIKDAWYPRCLAERLQGAEFTPGHWGPALIYFNVDQDFSFALSPPLIGLNYMLVGVAMHEILHVMGFGTTAKRGDRDIIISLYGKDPMEFFIKNSSGGAMASRPVSGQSLEDFVQSDDLGFTGNAAKRENSGVPVPIHAPPIFVSGKSCQHIKEGTYPIGSNNSLMEPDIAKGYFYEHMGEVGVAMMNDIGWKAILGIDKLSLSENQIKVFPVPCKLGNPIQFEFGNLENEINKIELIDQYGVSTLLPKPVSGETYCASP